jgi:non-ribosomal peptide synthase protein (TIGR01720 family)
LLHEAPAAYHTQIQELLLTAMLFALGRWTGRHWMLLDIEGHGRDPVLGDMDLSRTIGWFTCLYPLVLEADLARDPGHVIKTVKEQIRQVPGRGIGYGLLRYLSGDETAAALAALPASPVLFNYLGQLDAPVEVARLGEARSRGQVLSTGPVHSSRGVRTHLLEANGGIVSGRLQFRWTYSERVHRQETIETVAREFVDALDRLVAHCRTADPAATPSDFVRARVSQKDLDTLLSRLRRPSA